MNDIELQGPDKEGKNLYFYPKDNNIGITQMVKNNVSLV